MSRHSRSRSVRVLLIQEYSPLVNDVYPSMHRGLTRLAVVARGMLYLNKACGQKAMTQQKLLLSIAIALCGVALLIVLAGSFPRLTGTAITFPLPHTGACYGTDVACKPTTSAECAKQFGCFVQDEQCIPEVHAVSGTSFGLQPSAEEAATVCTEFLTEEIARRCPNGSRTICGPQVFPGTGKYDATCRQFYVCEGTPSPSPSPTFPL